MTIDPARVADIIRYAAQAEILPRFQHLSAAQIHEKKPGQLVTEADIEAEKVLARRLCELLPGAAVVGEEGVEANPGVLAVLDQPGKVWVIDPVDGTANFAKGNPRFGVIVALVEDGKTTGGWIFDPLSDRMVIALVGEGAWIGPRRLEVADTELGRMRGSACRRTAMASRVAKAGRKGSAAHDYIDLVTGELEFAHFTHLMPWDHAAGVLIHAEAGGHGRLISDRPYRPTMCDNALLLAPSASSWRALRALVE